jgi:hypothetical protein
VNWAGLDLSNWGPSSLLALGVLLLFLGLMVPRRQLTDLRKDKDAQIKALTEEKDEWKAAYFASDKTTRELSGQLQATLEQGRTTEAVIRAIPKRADADE